jgi:Zn finger protein HypA/HybF involved in hydrogenase expression
MNSKPNQREHSEHKPATLRCECGEPVAVLQDGSHSVWCETCRAKLAQAIVGDVDAQ